MAAQAHSRFSARSRPLAIRVAAIAIIMLGVGAALLPVGKSISSDLIGGLLIAAGLVETIAGALRRESRPFVMAAGCVTALAGLLFVINPTTHFFPNVTLVIAWLFLRALILGVAVRLTGGSVRTWTAISAGVDLALGLLLMTGLSIATIVISLFGPTEPLVASFSWFLAVSFVVNGLMLLEVSSCEKAAA